MRDVVFTSERYAMKYMPLILILVATTVGAQHDGRYDRARDDARWHGDDRGDGGDDLQLVCFGEGEKTTLDNHSGYVWNASTHKYEAKSELVTGRQDFDTSVNVSIHGDQGRIRMPKRLIPPMHSGGQDGWWGLDDLIVGHNEIRATFRLNALNRPKVIIDRRSGTMSVDGMIKFNGRCEQDSGHRRF